MNADDTLQPIQMQAGEVQTVIEMAQEFGESKVRLTLHEVRKSTKVVDVRTDCPERARFIRHVLDKMKINQSALEAVLKLNGEPSP